MFKISNIYDLFESVKENNQLYIPVEQKGGANFKQYESGDKLTENLNTVRSAKDFFFPQTENMAEFKVSGKHIEVIDNRSEMKDYVMFGVRACDYKSFEILDRVYLVEPIDTYYKNRREHGIIITLACNNPEKTCFCSAFGIDPSQPQGDVRAYKIENEFYFEPLTEKGNNFIEKYKTLFTETDSEAVEKEKQDIKNKIEKLPLKELKPKDFRNLQKETFNSEKWKDLYKSCVGCGTCTFVCPTCQCYDIKDFNTGHGVKRFRCWDSCMYSDFTLMAGGNPRPTQLERFRQRFMHKLVYFPINNDGIYGCVGCGRCVKKCPISMNIVKVMKTLGDE